MWFIVVEGTLELFGIFTSFSEIQEFVTKDCGFTSINDDIYKYAREDIHVRIKCLNAPRALSKIANQVDNKQ